MKARKVKGLDPEGTLAENARRIVAVRLDEVRSFTPAALDPAEVEALHDMRIATKRLRYVLELARPALGEPAGKGARTAKRLQDVLGEIHDCDVMLPRLRRHEAVDAAAELAARRERLHAKFRRQWRRLEDGEQLSRLLAPSGQRDGAAA
jgi:CHAD domain-containing protein